MSYLRHVEPQPTPPPAATTTTTTTTTADVELRTKTTAANHKSTWIRRLFSTSTKNKDSINFKEQANKTTSRASLQHLPQERVNLSSRASLQHLPQEKVNLSSRASLQHLPQERVNLPSRASLQRLPQERVNLSSRASLQLLPRRLSNSTREYNSTMSYTQSSENSAQSMPIMRRRLPQSFDGEASELFDRSRSLSRARIVNDPSSDYTLQQKYLSLPAKRETMIFTPIRPRSTFRRSRKSPEDKISKMRRRLSSQLIAMQRLGPSHYLARIEELDDEDVNE